MFRIKLSSAFLKLFVLGVMFLPNQPIQSEIVHDKFVVFTPPKCGTHLLTKVVELIIDKKVYQKSAPIKSGQELFETLQTIENQNMFFSNHYVTVNSLNTLKKNEYKIITILRDPRDQLISRINWCLEGKWPTIPIGDMTKEEQINEFITGENFGFLSFEQAFECEYKWPLIRLLDPFTLYISHFENLVGPAGGGTTEKQILEIHNIANHIGVYIDTAEAYEIASEIFGKGPTFRNGQIGDWKKHFTESNKEKYKIRYGHILIDWGYEDDLEW